jgi:predicted ester cyclase
MEHMELEKIYRRYIYRLNKHATDDLSEFVLDVLSYNGVKITLQDYEGMLASDIDTIPDLRFNIDLLVVNNDYVACRILFNCTPIKEFRNLKPNGNPISFSENVFYRFKAGKIAEVWSLLDTAAIKEQLET